MGFGTFLEGVEGFCGVLEGFLGFLGGLGEVFEGLLEGFSVGVKGMRRGRCHPRRVAAVGRS